MIILVCCAGLVGAVEPEPGPAGRVPTLDELLGIAESQSQADGGRGAFNPELDRALSPGQARDALAQAAAMMGDSAALIQEGNAVGAGTQRLQRGIIDRLDRVIEAAQQQSGGKPPPDGSQQQSQQQNQPDQPQPGSGSRSGSSDSPGEGMRPGSTDADVSPDQPAAGVRWGALPERVRGVLMQGVGDRYSSLYERLTEAYYKKLAEEAEEQ